LRRIADWPTLNGDGGGINGKKPGKLSSAGLLLFFANAPLRACFVRD
jgi:hypothetical protein